MADPTLADAILDRLIHNAHHIELGGESVRKRLFTIAEADHFVPVQRRWNARSSDNLDLSTDVAYQNFAGVPSAQGSEIMLVEPSDALNSVNISTSLVAVDENMNVSNADHG